MAKAERRTQAVPGGDETGSVEVLEEGDGWQGILGRGRQDISNGAVYVESDLLAIRASM